MKVNNKNTSFSNFFKVRTFSLLTGLTVSMFLITQLYASNEYTSFLDFFKENIFFILAIVCGFTTYILVLDILVEELYAKINNSENFSYLVKEKKYFLLLEIFICICICIFIWIGFKIFSLNED